MDKKKIQQLLMSAWQSGTKITFILYIYGKKTHKYEFDETIISLCQHCDRIFKYSHRTALITHDVYTTSVCAGLF